MTGALGIPTLDDLAVVGKRVLLRADLNLPMKDGRITDDSRLRHTLPTIEELAQKRAKIIVVSHLGRPDGKRDPKQSLKPVADAMAKLMPKRRIGFAQDCVGAAAETAVDGLAEGDVMVLENLRFHAGEEANDPAFARGLAKLADLYVNDAFSAAHRAHASTAGVAALLPSAAGRLMQAELAALAEALEAPKRPVIAVVGGAKVGTKIDVLENLIGKVDVLVIGGAMANTFLQAQGVAVGRSLSEPDRADVARAILAKAAKSGCTVVLPTDAVVAAEFKAGAASRIVPVGAVPADAMILDVGPATVEAIVARLRASRTLVWNGPLGAFEMPPLDAGTTAVATAAAALTRHGKLVSIAGGGDTVAALANAKAGDGFTSVSLAGGAFLEWLEGKTLPGVAALKG